MPLDHQNVKVTHHTHVVVVIVVLILCFPSPFPKVSLTDLDKLDSIVLC